MLQGPHEHCLARHPHQPTLAEANKYASSDQERAHQSGRLLAGVKKLRHSKRGWNFIESQDVDKP